MRDNASRIINYILVALLLFSIIIAAMIIWIENHATHIRQLEADVMVLQLEAIEVNDENSNDQTGQPTDN